MEVGRAEVVGRMLRSGAETAALAAFCSSPLGYCVSGEACGGQNAAPCENLATGVRRCYPYCVSASVG